MKFRRQRRDELSINLTPLIDVVFLLLIFFMVSTSFTTQTQLAVNLPEADGEPAPKSASRIELSINAAGEYRLNGDPVLAEAGPLRRALRRVAGDNRDIPMTIAADGDAAHKRVVTALDVASAMGFTQLTIATQKPAGNPGRERDESGQ